MRPLYLVHIVAGSLALLSGYAALFARKGAPLHRRAGLLFVIAMLVMAVAGFAMALANDAAVAVNLPAATLTAYLVATSYLALRSDTTLARTATLPLMLVAVVTGVVSLSLGLEAIANGGSRRGIPAFPFFLFGIAGVLAAFGDLRVVRAGPPSGAPRLVRHLWRMTFALLIAALSFFIGQADELPAAIRKPLLLATPVLVVLLALLYWTWRVRVRRIVRGFVLREPSVRARPSAAAGAR